MYSGVHGDWTEAKSNEVHSYLVPLIYTLDANNRPLENKYLKNMKVYSQTHITSLVQGYRGFAASALDSLSIPEDKLTWNIAKSACDTVAAKISKNKVKVTIVCDNADWHTQRKAEKLDRAVYGLMYAGKFHQVAKRAFNDAEVCGTGIIQVIPGEDGVSYERVPPYECLVDDMDAQYGKPTRFYRWKLVPRHQLIQKFPKYEMQINQEQGVTSISGDPIMESILTFEAWALPTSSKGRHVICCGSVTLLDESFEDKQLPFAFIRWSAPSIGFWGISLVDEITPWQVAINKQLFHISQNMILSSTPFWLVPKDSVDKRHMANNQIGKIIETTGQAPQRIVGQPVHPQTIEWLMFLKNEAYAAVGVSQLSARSEKPAGLNSGKAISTYNDIESERFVLIGQSFEEMYVDIFNLTINAAKKVAAINPKFNVMSFTPKGAMEAIDWAAVDMDASKFTVKPYPTSALPQQPEARFAQLQEYMNIGLISQEEFIEMLDLPADMVSMMRRKNAAVYMAKETLAKIVDTGELVRANKYWDLETTLRIAIQELSFLEVNNCPEDTLDLIRTFIDDTLALKDSLQPPVPTQPTAPVEAVPPMPAMPM
jgi:hypothetical protein